MSNTEWSLDSDADPIQDLKVKKRIDKCFSDLEENVGLSLLSEKDQNKL